MGIIASRPILKSFSYAFPKEMAEAMRGYQGPLDQKNISSLRGNHIRVYRHRGFDVLVASIEINVSDKIIERVLESSSGDIIDKHVLHEKDPGEKFIYLWDSSDISRRDAIKRLRSRIKYSFDPGFRKSIRRLFPEDWHNQFIGPYASSYCTYYRVVEK